jgi:hypothetical protein
MAWEVKRERKISRKGAKTQRKNAKEGDWGLGIGRTQTVLGSGGSFVAAKQPLLFNPL